MHQITRNLYQNHQENKIYQNIYTNLRIKRFENWTSWRAVLDFARSTACKYPNPLYNAWNDVWWRKGSLHTCRSSSKQKLHCHLHELPPLDPCTNSTKQHLIYTKSKLRNQNMKSKCNAIWKNFELWMREKFEVRENFGSRNVKND